MLRSGSPNGASSKLRQRRVSIAVQPSVNRARVLRPKTVPLRRKFAEWPSYRHQRCWPHSLPGGRLDLRTDALLQAPVAQAGRLFARSVRGLPILVRALLSPSSSLRPSRVLTRRTVYHLREYPIKMQGPRGQGNCAGLTLVDATPINVSPFAAYPLRPRRSGGRPRRRRFERRQPHPPSAALRLRQQSRS